MKTTLICLLTLLVAGSMAQTTVVVQLKECDAAQAQQLFQAKQAADKAWEDFYAHVETAYGLVGDIEFSKEFRFIVPRPKPLPGWQVYGGYTLPLTGVYHSIPMSTDEWTVYGSPITKGPIFEDRFEVQQQQGFDNFFDVQQHSKLEGAFAVPHPELAPGTVIGEPTR